MDDMKIWSFWKSVIIGDVSMHPCVLVSGCRTSHSTVVQITVDVSFQYVWKRLDVMEM